MILISLQNESIIGLELSDIHGLIVIASDDFTLSFSSQDNVGTSYQLVFLA